MNTQDTDGTNWLSLADMMTAMMVIFMFIAVNYILQVIEYTFVEEDIYNSISEVFSEEIDDQTIRLGPDGSIRFNVSQNKEELFETAEPYPTDYFIEILVDFFPKYWEIIKSDPTYLDFIKEIRIEGHSDPRSLFKETDTLFTEEVSYLNNLELSQARAKNVLKMMREQPFYLNANEREKARMDFLFTAIGFSHSRSINRQGNYVYLNSNKHTSNDLSRRVEVRIVTSNESLAKELSK